MILRRSARARRISPCGSRTGRQGHSDRCHQGVSRARSAGFARQTRNWIRSHLKAGASDADCWAAGAVGVQCPLVQAQGACCLTEVIEIPGAGSVRALAAHAQAVARRATLARRRMTTPPRLGGTIHAHHPARYALAMGVVFVAGALMYSWRLIMAPAEVLHYVAAHEVAHLAEMNHSRLRSGPV